MGASSTRIEQYARSLVQTDIGALLFEVGRTFSDVPAELVTEFDGAPLTREHGGPARLLVPHLYFWKSAKWISRIELTLENEQGFWERGGYHDYGDPWREQRYQGD